MNVKLLLLVVFISSAALAQQDAQFTQYMYNTINVNPAYAGSRGVMSAFALHRTQWIGMDGAPVTNAFSINTPVGNRGVGLGFSAINDRIGPTNENNFSIDFSYTVKTSETFKLSFGLKATANIFDLDPNKLNPQQQGDPSLQGFDNEFNPNIGAGIYWHSDKSYVGLSVPGFIETSRYNDSQIVVNQEKLNFYLIGGYVFDVSPLLKFKPALLTKMVAGAPLQVDVSANFMYNDKFVLGGAYRWDAAFSATVGFQVTDGIYIGYAYDLDTTDLGRYNSGSHEFFLRFELRAARNKIISPRFF